MINTIKPAPRETIKGFKIKVVMKITISPNPKNSHFKSNPSRIRTKKSPKNTNAVPGSG